MLLEIAMALAIQDATTTCNTFGGQVTCQTRQQTNPADSFNRGMENGMRMGESMRRAREERDANPLRCAGSDWWMIGCSRAQHDAGRDLQQTQARVAGARDRVMTHLRAGDCQAAVGAALETGDLAFATEVRTFCAGQP